MTKITLMTVLGLMAFSGAYGQMTLQELEQGREAKKEPTYIYDPEEYFYRQETKPPVDNQDPDYYMEDHPLQEEPLPHGTVE